MSVGFRLPSFVSVCVLVPPIWVVLKHKWMQNKTYYSAILNYIHFICTSCLISLSSNYLKISIKHLCTSSEDYRLLYLASACFLSLPFDFFYFRRFFSLPLAFVCIGLRLFAFRLRFSTTRVLLMQV